MLLNSCVRRASRILSKTNNEKKIVFYQSVFRNVKHYSTLGTNLNNIEGKCLKTFRIVNPRKFLLNKYFSSPLSRVSCWNCGKSNESVNNVIFCNHCNTVQKPQKDQNYFEIIGIDKQYALDEASLTKKYKDLQKLLHPDKFSNRKKSEQEISAEYSSLVNKAYSTLLQPLSRGTYMLRLKGYEIPEKTQLESKFLHEIMERNEEVESASTPEEILKINKENKQVISDLVTKLSDAFDKQDLETAKNILIHMKYYVSIENQIKGMIREMGIVE